MGKEEKEFLYGDLTYIINGILFAVHNKLGRFAREKQYSEEIEERCKQIGLAYKREIIIGDDGNTCDFIIKDLIIIEVKAVPVLQNKDFEQVKRYLKSTQLRLGILVNFRAKFLKPLRILAAHHL